MGTYENGICTLTQDVTSPIYIAVAGLTLDGAGYTLESGGFQDAAIGVQAAGVTVKNLNIVTDARYAVNVTADGDGAQITQVVSQNAFFGTRVLQAEDVVIEDLFLDGGNGNGFGIALSESKDTTINRITAKGGRSGINMFAADRVVIETSSFVENEIGVDIQDTTDVVLSNSTLIANQEAGVNIVRANEIEIVGNTIDFTDSSGQRNGFVINESTEIDSVTVWNNEIIAALIGIDDRTQYDFGGPGDPGGPIQQSFLDSVRQTFLVLRSYLVPTVLAQGVAHITFWNNDFVDVSVAHTISDLAYGIMTLSNGNGTTGNYWSSYDSDDEGCVDDNTDGTCDEPYILPSQNLDGYLPDFAAQTQPVAAVSIEASPTCELTAPSEVSLDEPFTISYTTQDATGGLLPSVGIIDDTDGSITATPDEVGTTIYQLVVWGDGAPSDCEVTVEVVETAAPTGASSVLFLPGIQASRLYTTESDGSEKLLWEPDFLFDDADVLRLAMTPTGESIENIYVRDVIDYAPVDNPSAETAVYGGFLKFLDELVNLQQISEYSAFAYDWRYDVFDIVSDGVQYKDERRFLVEEVERLAANSASDKVAIVAHSNGGLLGKALIDELERQGKSELVESLIMIGTPQLGTPKAIGSLLHGTDQGLSWDRFDNIQPPIITDKAVREAARNMPGAYGLLPGQAYYAAAGDVIVLFDTGISTEPWRSSYGNALQSESELDDFLTSTANGRDNVPFSNTDRAIVANQALLDNARSTRHQLDTWQSPGDIAVTSITGTGLSTISGFEYVTISERFCAGSTCTPINFYRPKAIQSFRGDQTVMTVSGEGGSVVGQDRYYVDLESIDVQLDKLFIHKNLTESDIIQGLVVDLLSNTDVETNQFINQTGFTYPDQQLFTYGGNSPVYLLVTDDQGRRTGQLDATTVVEEIPGSRWFAIGGATYVSVPTDIDHTVTMQAYDEGSVTLTVDEVTDDQQVLLYAASIPIVTSNTNIELVYQSDSFGQLQVDLDGDLDTDQVRSITDGSLLTSIEIEQDTSIENRSSSASATRVVGRVATPQVLGVSISDALSSEQQQLIVTMVADIQILMTDNKMNVEQTKVVETVLQSLLALVSE